MRAIAAITDDVNERQTLLDEAIAVLETGDVRHELARTLMQRGVLERRCGSLDETTALFERALAVAIQCRGRTLIDELAAHSIADASV